MEKTDETVISLIRETLPNVISIYRFGSAGTTFENKESDVDLAVLTSQKIDSVACWELAEKIASKIGRDVDLVDLFQASTVLRVQVMNTGTRIFCKNKKLCDSFENMVYSAYIRFNEERKGILDDIKQRGKIGNG